MEVAVEEVAELVAGFQVVEEGKEEVEEDEDGESTP